MFHTPKPRHIQGQGSPVVLQTDSLGDKNGLGHTVSQRQGAALNRPWVSHSCPLPVGHPFSFPGGSTKSKSRSGKVAEQGPTHLRKDCLEATEFCCACGTHYFWRMQGNWKGDLYLTIRIC